MPIVTLCTIIEQLAVGDLAVLPKYNNVVFDGALSQIQMENAADNLYTVVLTNHCGKIRRTAETLRDSHSRLEWKEAREEMEADLIEMALANGQFPNWTVIPYIMDSFSYGKEYFIVNCYLSRYIFGGVQRSPSLLTAWPKVTYQFRIFDATPYQDLTRIELY